jgi:hydrogenase maturation protein HypF
VRGVVQGVGFRPFVYNLAQRHHLSGFVGNNSNGVFIEIEGDNQSLESFCHELQHNPPPLAHIESITVETLNIQYSHSFTIVISETQAGQHTLISPDLSICDDCLRELFDPNDRRYRYPFINCTNCGPRFTIIQDLPYDRPLTTMRDFPMCKSCAAEYHDPTNRRFHAQPNACPDCGPQVFLGYGQAGLQANDAILTTQALLRTSHIVAIKGIGGFHLACDATDDNTILRLRERKGRQAKPFAVMVRDLEMAQQLAFVDSHEERLLMSRERPIILLKKRDSRLSQFVAPENQFVGLMLPYTALHYLLIEDFPLVMTSGNYTNQPIIKDNDRALDKLASIADAFLLHDRDIHVACDDSVIHVLNNQELPIRRSRGYAPFPVKLPFEIAPILAVGGDLKSTFCLTKQNHAFMSQHIGDIENLETIEAFTHALEHFKAIFGLEPHYIACDLHSRYLSTHRAENYARDQAIPLIKVQHHHAHIASVMAENGLTEPVIGFAYDGTGYGTDGAIWGSEVLIGDYKKYERIAHLPYMPLVGGDAAIKNPYRLALAYLWAAGIDWDDDLPPVQHSTRTEQRILKQQLARHFNVVQTSSMGRLFDVVAALIGLRQIVTYEAQAAIELESIAVDSDETYQVSPYDIPNLLQNILIDLNQSISTGLIAAKFHHWVADSVVQQAVQIRKQNGINGIALSGGVFQNIRLLTAVVNGLNSQGFDVYTHHLVPPNDGGLALGQAVIASQMIQGG